jgi:hypothetical protein
LSVESVENFQVFYSKIYVVTIEMRYITDDPSGGVVLILLASSENHSRDASLFDNRSPHLDLGSGSWSARAGIPVESHASHTPLHLESEWPLRFSQVLGHLIRKFVLTRSVTSRDALLDQVRTRLCSPPDLWF